MKKVIQRLCFSIEGYVIGVPKCITSFLVKNVLLHAFWGKILVSDCLNHALSRKHRNMKPLCFRLLPQHVTSGCYLCEFHLLKIQRITIGILNELSFWLKYGVLLLQGVPYTPLEVRFRPGHLNMTHGNPKSWYWQPADHLEVVRKCYEKAPSEKGWFWGCFEKPPIMACMFLQCQDMVRTCYKS